MLKDIHFTLFSDTQRFETWLERFRLAALPHQLPFSADKTLWIFHLPTFLFTSKSKSDLGWKFLFLIETGRFKDYLLKTLPSTSPPVQQIIFKTLRVLKIISNKYSFVRQNFANLKFCLALVS